MQETIDKLLLHKNITLAQVFWLKSLKEIVNTLTLEQAIAWTKQLNNLEEELNAKSL